MRISRLSLLGHAAFSAAHGYVKSLTLDNTVYPGFDLHQDLKLHAKRIVFSCDPAFSADGIGPITDVNSPGIACNARSKPSSLVGRARAGSTVTFQWTPWVINHKGPLIAYMARYEGDIAKNDVNKLIFFKIAERAVSNQAKWATDEMIDNGNSWNITIPWDIKPGTYLLRHELLALHFANGGIPIGTPGPQFYLMCAAVDIEGPGAVEPAGVTFPGAYKKDDPGLIFKLYPKDIQIREERLHHTRSEAVPGIRSSSEASTKAGESDLSHRRPSHRQDLLQKSRC